MAKQVVQFSAPSSDQFPLLVPQGAKFLEVQVVNGQAQLWFEVDTDALGDEQCVFSLVAPSQDVPEGGLYRGTFQLAGGFIVRHLYEILP